MHNILSIDVEDWFHILELDSTPDLQSWSELESRVEENFLKLLDILDEKGARATCFFLGWIAEKHPRIVKEAAKRKHEIASHGYAHQLIHTQSQDAFFDDVSKTKKLLEDMSGEAVVGYRAPGFSITPETKWAFEQLCRAGYTYDSSLFPAKRGHGYFLDTKLYPYKLPDMDFYEFPLTVAHVFSKTICFFGGGYLRLFPYLLIRRMARQVEREQRPVIYYVHPREIDPEHPRLNMNIKRRFKSYVNLKTTENKLRRIVLHDNIGTYANFLAAHPDYFVRPLPETPELDTKSLHN